MRAILLLFALLAGGSAAYLAGDRGPTDVLVIVTAAAAVFALAMYKATPAGRSEKRKGWAPAPVHTSAMREEASELAESLNALANARGSTNEEALAGKATVDVFLRRAGPNQIAVIKVIRGHLHLGLREAKVLTDAAKRGERPPLAKAMPAETARAFARDLERAGGQLEFR